MKQNNLGETGISVSAIGFGGSRLGNFLLSEGPKKTKALLHLALDLGITLFDTADVYGRGLSERAIGAAFRKQRDQVVLLTKAGYLPLRRKATRDFAALFPRSRNRPRKASSSQDFSAQYLIKALDASLRRLKTDYVDVFLVHSLPFDELGIPESVDALERMRAAGKCRAYGFSLAASPSGRLDLSGSGIQVVGIPIHPESARLETAMRHLSEQRIGALAYRPFGSGALFDCDQAQSVPGDRKATPTEMALRYALDLPAVASVVVGTSKRRHLVENVELVGDVGPSSTR